MTEQTSTPAIASLVARKVHEARTHRGPQMGHQGTPISLQSKIPTSFWVKRGKPMSAATATRKLKSLHVTMSGLSYSMAQLLIEARSRGISGALVMSRLQSGWTIERALYEFKPEPKTKTRLTSGDWADLDEYFIKYGHRDGVNYVSQQFTGRRKLAKLIPKINGQLERCKPSKPCMNSSCRKCYELTREEERSWPTHHKTQAGAAIADPMARYDQSELQHFVTLMHSHEGFDFDPHARTAEFQADMESALMGSDVVASGLAEIQPAMDSGVPGISFHYHGVMATKMSRSELRKRLHQVWPEPGQVVIQDVDPEMGGCAGIGSYAVKERILVPPDVAEVVSASQIALQMMLLWQSWKIEDRHVAIGCPQMTMTPVEPQNRSLDVGHRSAHDVDPPCGGWTMDSADACAYWARYEELGDLDDGCFLTVPDEVFEELGDASDEDCMTDTLVFQDDDSVDTFFRSFFNKSMGISDFELGESLMYSPYPENRGTNSPRNASKPSSLADAYPDIGSASGPYVPTGPTWPQDQCSHRRNVPA